MADVTHNGTASASERGCGKVLIAALVLAGLQLWTNWALLKTGAAISLSLFGGLVLAIGLFGLFGMLRRESRSWIKGGMSLLCLLLGFWTFAPVYPASWLHRVPFGKSVLTSRQVRFKASVEKKDWAMVQRLARLGLPTREPRDSFGDPLLSDIQDPQTLDIVLEAGLNPDARDKHGRTVLMNTHEPELAGILIQHGADVNARDREGSTPLMLGYHASEAYYKALLEAHADPFAVDQHGRSVVDFIRNPGLLTLIRQYSYGQPLPEPRGEDRVLGSTSWLESESTYYEGDEAQSGSRTGLTVTPDPMRYGDRAEVLIRIENTNEHDMAYSIEASLNSVALFVGATEGGYIAEPESPQLVQTIRWPQLALPAGRSGLLKLDILARRFGGDLSVDVRVMEIGANAADEPLVLSSYQPLSQQSYGEGTPFLSFAFIFFAPLTFIIWIVTRMALGKDHTVARVSGRVCSGAFALLLGMIAFFGYWDMVKQFTSLEETTGTILDRRYYLESSQGTKDSRGRRTTHTYGVPVACVAYETPMGPMVSSGFASQNQSLTVFNRFPLGSEVRLWYNPEHPERFVLLRQVGVVFPVILLFLAAIALLLADQAFRGPKSLIQNTLKRVMG